MGTVLEMSRRAAAGLALVAGLSACAEVEGEAAGEAIFAGAQRIAAAITAQQDAEVARPRTDLPSFAPAEIAAAPGEFRLVRVTSLGLNELARVVEESGPRVTIEFESGPTAAFDHGVLVATRGFGDDLHTIDGASLRAALAAGGGTLIRRLETIDAQDQIATQGLTCAITAAGTETVDLGLRQETLRRFDEHCRSALLVFDNIYWLDAAGEIAASRQFVSPTVAYLRTNRL
jgi:hypothetical protein